jgi:hypothetical protein
MSETTSPSSWLILSWMPVDEGGGGRFCSGSPCAIEPECTNVQDSDSPRVEQVLHGWFRSHLSLIC